MASITLPIGAEKDGRLRALNILRDLPQVADLIELCFKSTMDDEGQSYLQQMRQASGDRDFLSWAGRLVDSASMPLAGFVWEEGGKIVGNASLVFQTHRGRKLAMIANVATDPGYRRGGIGRALTQNALDGARQRGAKEIWLQVRDDNQTAIRIYSDLGFVERARRTTYRSRNILLTTPAPAQPGNLEAENSTQANPITVARRAESRHWSEQAAWLERAHPDNLGWYDHWNWGALGPGFRNTLRRVFTESEPRHWSALSRGELLATVTWVPTVRTVNSLWLGAPRDTTGLGPQLALEAARRDLPHHHRLKVEYPAGELEQSIQNAGFEPHRTLIWMMAPATSGSG